MNTKQRINLMGNAIAEDLEMCTTFPSCQAYRRVRMQFIRLFEYELSAETKERLVKAGETSL